MNRFDLFVGIHNKIIQINKYYDSNGAYMLPNSTATRSPIFDQMLTWDLKNIVTGFTQKDGKTHYHKDGTTELINNDDIYAKVAFLTAIQDTDSKTAAYLLVYDSNCKEITCHLEHDVITTEENTIPVYFINKGIFDPDKFTASDVLIHLMGLALQIMDTENPSYWNFDGADPDINVDDSGLVFVNEFYTACHNIKSYYEHQLDYVEILFVLHTMTKFFDINIDQFITLFTGILCHGFYDDHLVKLYDTEEQKKTAEKLEYDWILKRYTKKYGNCNINKYFSQAVAEIRKGVFPDA